ncbi:MAG: hypothetical protein V1755_01065 [Chloroflexota bacterium]
MREHASWLGQLLKELEESSQAGTEAVQYLRARGVRLGIHDQPTAARWTLGRNIELHPRYAQGSAKAPYALSLVVHEIQHLRQGLTTALSVYGELDAWQVQFNFLRALAGRYPGTAEQARLIRELLGLPLGWDRAVLRSARGLMQRYAGKRYRIDLLPLYPLRHELLYGISRQRPG